MNISSLSDDEFNEMLNGPLAHPMPMFAITRLALALRAVVNATGDAGVAALRQHCAVQQASDEFDPSDIDEDDLPQPPEGEDS